uniref:HDC15396 n=1 Tax=Drosophila melanogaster TaxID=7227 RepID=Q6IJA8_DROME|nr:TPA_inf: HDC15396 [Drosophila melanogaster]
MRRHRQTWLSLLPMLLLPLLLLPLLLLLLSSAGARCLSAFSFVAHKGKEPRRHKSCQQMSIRQQHTTTKSTSKTSDIDVPVSLGISGAPPCAALCVCVCVCVEHKGAADWEKAAKQAMRAVGLKIKTPCRGDGAVFLCRHCGSAKCSATTSATMIRPDFWRKDSEAHNALRSWRLKPRLNAVARSGQVRLRARESPLMS